MMTNTKEARETLADGQKVRARIQNNWCGIFEKNLWYIKNVDGFALSKRRRRYYHASAITEYELLEDKPKQTWEQAWRAIAKSCRKHNVNLWLADIIEENLRIGLPALQELEELERKSWNPAYKYGTPEYEAHKQHVADAYKAWVTKYGSTQGEHPTYHLSMGTQNHWGARMPKVTAMNLPKYYIDDAWKQALETGKGYASQNTYHHSGRDRSLEVKKNDDGSLRAWYASEYMGCGNGAYYIPISKSRVLYSEHD